MSTKHDLDEFTDFCRRCGESLESIVDLKINNCIEDNTNVVAISHMVRGGRLRQIVMTVMEGLEPKQRALTLAIDEYLDKGMRK